MKRYDIKSVIEIILSNNDTEVDRKLYEVSELKKATNKVYHRLIEDDVNGAKVIIHFKKEYIE